MFVLFDNGVPHRAASVLKGHVVEEARDRGWDRLTNDDLLRAAEAAGFDVLLTTDRNIRYQQNRSNVLLVALWFAVHPGVLRADPECASANCECTDGGATWQFGSGTLDCGTADALCETACENCTGGGGESTDCDSGNRTVDCECEPGEGEG